MLLPHQAQQLAVYGSSARLSKFTATVSKRLCLSIIKLQQIVLFFPQVNYRKSFRHKHFSGRCFGVNRGKASQAQLPFRHKLSSLFLPFFKVFLFPKQSCGILSLQKLWNFASYSSCKIVCKEYSLMSFYLLRSTTTRPSAIVFRLRDICQRTTPSLYFFVWVWGKYFLYYKEFDQ